MWNLVSKFSCESGPKLTYDLRTIFRQFLDLWQSYDNWRIHRTFTTILRPTVKPIFSACPLFQEFREFCEPDKFVKITGRENLNSVAFQCSGKQKRQNYEVQNN